EKETRQGEHGLRREEAGRRDTPSEPCRKQPEGDRLHRGLRGQPQRPLGQALLQRVERALAQRLPNRADGPALSVARSTPYVAATLSRVGGRDVPGDEYRTSEADEPE